jgi:hypothetical protein
MMKRNFVMTLAVIMLVACKTTEYPNSPRKYCDRYKASFSGGSVKRLILHTGLAEGLYAQDSLCNDISFSPIDFKLRGTKNDKVAEKVLRSRSTILSELSINAIVTFEKQAGPPGVPGNITVTEVLSVYDDKEPKR